MISLVNLKAIEGILLSNRLTITGDELPVLFQVVQAVQSEIQRLQGIGRVSPAPTPLPADLPQAIATALHDARVMVAEPEPVPE